MTAQEPILSFARHISWSADSEGAITLCGHSTRLTIDTPYEGIEAALRMLSEQGATAASLAETAAQPHGFAARASMLYYLERFNRLGLITYTVRGPDGNCATFVPIGEGHKLNMADLETDKPYQLSRFAFLHREDNHLVLRSPRSPAKVQIDHPATLSLLHELSQPHTLRDLQTKNSEKMAEATEQILGLLLGSHLLTTTHDESRADEEANTAFAHWEFHDLLFHAGSRLGRQSNGYGRTFRLQDRMTPQPAIKTESDSRDALQLYRPDIETLVENDLPFTRVLESRMSTRVSGSTPITLRQLGEFLYRTARIRTLNRSEDVPYAYSNRPYPSGGATYEMEFYILPNLCSGLARDLYHYQPLKHQLFALQAAPQDLDLLSKQASSAMSVEQPPQVLVLLAARFQRVTWKYEGMAYALMLKHVGVIYQTMYLVATAMNLAACAIGGGDSDLFSKAARTDYYLESSVGEFALGSKPGADS